MKAYLKPLVAAVALCAAGGANAAIDLGGTGNGDNSELFMSAWDPVKGVSYTRDLGIHFEDFLATAQNSGHTWLGSDNTVWNIFSSSGSNLSDVRWNVTAINNFNSSFTNAATYGYMSTLTPGGDPAAIKTTTDLNLASVDNAIGYGKGFIQSVNVNNNPALNDTTSSTGGPSYAGGPAWGNNFAGVVGYLNDAGLGQSMAFYQVAENADFTSSIVTQLAGMFSLASDGTLTYSVVPTVPVPPALWLLGSALVGLVGVSRRKRESSDEGLMA